MNQFQEPLSKHDAEVLRIANSFRDRGYHVRADVPGYPQPGLIDRLHRPDIEAEKANDKGEWVTLIIEVETADSVETEHTKSQKATFRKRAKENENTWFKLHVVK